MFISRNEFEGRLGFDGLVSALRAGGEPSRLRALALLARGELAVGELAQALGQSQPRISRHLKLLTESGLAERAPEGAWVFYRLPAEGSAERALAEDLVSRLDPADPVLARDRERLLEIHAVRAAAAAAYFDENAEDWGRLRALHLPDVDIEAAVIEAAGPGPFDQMIDVGVGSGRMLEIFADKTTRADGFDTSRQMLALARAALAARGDAKASVRLGDIYDPPFPQGQAALVTVHQVLHFLPDPRRAVINAAGLLRPGGRLVLVDFAPHGLEFLRERHAHRRLGFSDDEIRAWCAAGGVASVTVRTLAPPQGGGEALTVKIWAGNRVEGART